MISSLNARSFFDTLIVILGPDKGATNSEKNGDVVRLTNEDNQVIGYNFFNVSSYTDIDPNQNGQVFLAKKNIDELNKKLADSYFDADLTVDDQPKIVYGFVETCEPHPDSDHMNITTIDAGQLGKHQIVCGAPNIAQGQKVVVALSGAMMPNGQLIWPGKLRGVDSSGMICSAKELGLEHAPTARGILVMPEKTVAGDAFKPNEVDELLANGVI
ncbi:YtpR family tRNA-binding protein [Holzapfeliella sp. JNUCC 72]